MKTSISRFPLQEEVRANGIELGEMNRLLLEKIEGLTLYILEEEGKHKDHKIKIDQMEKRILQLENHFETNNRY